MGIFDNIILELALIFAGASILATIFLYLKQPIILAYIFLGMLVGPWGIGLFEDSSHIEHISHLGIILLMFLIGLNLHPQKLSKLLKRTALITMATCLVFALPTMLTARLFQFSWSESLIVGLSLMFSSTVVCVKLVPVASLHHKHIGEIMISILLLQDIIAVGLILFLYGSGATNIYVEGLLLLLKTIVFTAVSYLLVRYAILALFRRFDKIQDYIFLMSLGWCLLCAEVAGLIGLSYEIGAFIAGIMLAISPIALYVSEGLKPVREFFLILFFFSIGAQFDFLVTKQVILPGVILAGLVLLMKPYVFNAAFRLAGESASLAKELGIRLGQSSEFSLLVAYGAFNAGRIEARTSYLIQLAAISTFIISTYLVVYKYPTPISANKPIR
ncbi:MAG: cation:proton antiporter domain-containing protein [Planctomycetota bacterium]|jgi:Kef-type K+ transport system membrane component KefB